MNCRNPALVREGDNGATQSVNRRVKDHEIPPIYVDLQNKKAESSKIKLTEQTNEKTALFHWSTFYAYFWGIS